MLRRCPLNCTGTLRTSYSWRARRSRKGANAPSTWRGSLRIRSRPRNWTWFCAGSKRSGTGKATSSPMLSMLVPPCSPRRVGVCHLVLLSASWQFSLGFFLTSRSRRSLSPTSRSASCGRAYLARSQRNGRGACASLSRSLSRRPLDELSSA
eukprot:Amastigsp_a176247_33.p2 type:complete len:152 gc:universal Amastigsp_a176247_33:1121-1576(+)